MRKYLIMLCLSACAASTPNAGYFPAPTPDGGSYEDVLPSPDEGPVKGQDSKTAITCVPGSVFCADDRHTAVCTASGHDYWLQSTCWLQENLICSPSCEGPYGTTIACCIWKKQN